MAIIWRMTNHAMQDLGRGRKANWIELANTTAGAYNTVFVYGGVFDPSNVTVSDFLNCGPAHGSGGSEANNYVRTPLTGVAYDIATAAASPMFKAANMNIPASGTMDTNFCAIYPMNPGNNDQTRNVIAIANLGAQSVSSGTNLVLNDLTPGIIQLDDPNQ